MAVIGYHASHEQFSPSALLRYVRLAEHVGFGAVLSSDHFSPWSEQQGESGYAWSWLGAAMQQTAIPFGIVTAPGQRYHPAITAQAVATLLEMFTERFWLAVGSGQALNEHITGDGWPEKRLRNDRLREAAEVMRALWRGEIVSHEGLVRVENARLYTLPASPPRLIGAAITPETARWLGEWADGLITVTQPEHKHHEVARAFREGGGAGKPVLLKVQLSYARDESEARAVAHQQWRNNIFKSEVLSDLRLPSQFDALGEFVRPEELEPYVRISSRLEQHLEWINEDLAFGFDEVYLHNVGLNQEEFIEVIGERVLPALVRSWRWDRCLGQRGLTADEWHTAMRADDIVEPDFAAALRTDPVLVDW